MGKVLSDIDLSRSATVAAFLELEVAARSCRCFSCYILWLFFLSLSLIFAFQDLFFPLGIHVN